MLFKVATEIEGNQAPFLKWMSFFVSFCIEGALNQITIFIWCIRWISCQALCSFESIACNSLDTLDIQTNAKINTSCVCITKQRLASLASVRCLPAYVLKVHSWISFDCWRRKIESIRSWTLNNHKHFAYENCTRS